MRLALASLALGLFLSRPAGADPVKTWNGTALDAIRKQKLNDAQAARLLAMVNVAIYDAVNGIEGTRSHALVAPQAPLKGADPVAAANAAARGVLIGVVPSLKGSLEEIAASAGSAWGAQVAAAVLAARANDGSAPEESQAGVNAPGKARASWSSTQFRKLSPFAVARSDAYVTAGPPALDSLDYAAGLAEVRILGNAAHPDAGKLEIYQFWAGGSGNVNPPGEWVKIALAITDRRQLDLPSKARLFALLGMALSDAVAPTFETKFRYQAWRPGTAIREAAEGGAMVAKDAAWAPRAGTIGGSPEHISGHSSFSGAAATVLQRFFCDDAIPFSFASDTAPGGRARSYASISAAEAEAGRSRVLGGIHFEFSNRDGIAMGRGVAAEVTAKKLLRKQGPTHVGHCPL